MKPASSDQNPPPLRLAMWSGPRNISTAMMRSWGNRPDTFVCDEPLYAHYLAQTGKDHHVADDVIAAGETDPRRVIDWLTGPVPGGKRIWYQKHMTHHLLPTVDRSWLSELTNCFLIREPREVITSLVKHVPNATLEDTGFPQQAEIFELVRRSTGEVPPTLDARDILNDPRRVLGLLCERLNVDFTNAMLSWPAGLRDTDGIWAKHWYKEVETTTSFKPYKPKDEPIADSMRDVLAACESFYEQLYPHRLR
jgi:hypothetical protein